MIIFATSTKMDQMVRTAKEFIMSITPRITYSPDPGTEYTLSLGITPKMISDPLFERWFKREMI